MAAMESLETYESAIPYVDPLVLSKECIPRQVVYQADDLPTLFNSIGLNRVISVVLNLSRSVAGFGLLDDQSKIDRLERSASLLM